MFGVGTPLHHPVNPSMSVTNVYKHILSFIFLQSVIGSFRTLKNVSQGKALHSLMFLNGKFCINSLPKLYIMFPLHLCSFVHRTVASVLMCFLPELEMKPMEFECT